MIRLEIEHIILMAGILILLMGLLWDAFYILGAIFCLASYIIDLVKRMYSETTCPMCCNKGEK